MKGKKEKTEYGTVKAVMPRNKKARYEEITHPEGVEAEEVSGEEKPFDLSEAIQNFMDAMEKMEKSKGSPETSSGDSPEEAENDDSEEEGDGGEGDDEEKESDKEKEPKENDLLTELLATQLRIRALGEIFGADKVSQIGVSYKSYILCSKAEGEIAEIRIMQTPSATVISSLVTGTFPYFKDQDRAEAFLELCGELMKEYCSLVFLLDAQKEAVKPIKVINS